MSTKNDQMPAWDQQDYTDRAESLEAEIAALEARLVAAGQTPEARPAIVHDDVVASVELLESHAPKLRVMTDLTERRAQAATRAQAKPASHSHEGRTVRGPAPGAGPHTPEATRDTH